MKPTADGSVVVGDEQAPGAGEILCPDCGSDLVGNMICAVNGEQKVGGYLKDGKIHLTEYGSVTVLSDGGCPVYYCGYCGFWFPPLLRS